MNGLYERDTFKIRLGIAAVTLLLVIILDLTDKAFAGISMKELYRTISMDYFKFIAEIKNSL